MLVISFGGGFHWSGYRKPWMAKFSGAWMREQRPAEVERAAKAGLTCSRLRAAG
ncbi:hypothetical protein QWZ13_16940 [Reinekea marina]|uniref:hypothetical protein n=1 Tax=Reinekea marina TaxID=1310421 RepID=UPI0025B3D74D|nr:hypothetical protein [Reinekea marina]MDN3650593.1 hypothetical protein [Reinekea marina]